LVDSEEEE
jgi:hypothetical protein